VFDARFDVGVGSFDEAPERRGAGERSGLQLDVAHTLAGALQEASGIGKRGSLKETDVDVGGEDVDVGKRRVSQTRDRAAVVEEFEDLVAGTSHH
jgi:hypothetical protein